jgi:hypothetical protein
MKQEVTVCDGGCGKTFTAEQNDDNAGEVPAGWYVANLLDTPPRSTPKPGERPRHYSRARITIEACSKACLHKALATAVEKLP